MIRKLTAAWDAHLLRYAQGAHELADFYRRGRRMRRLEQQLTAILERLNQMPSLTELQAAVDEVKVAVDAAADRVINMPAVEVPQGVIDELFVVKAKADSILPA